MLRDLTFSAGFVEFMAKAGVDVLRRSGSVLIADHEAGFSVSAPGPDWFEVRRFSRGVSDHIDSRFRHADDLERYLLLMLGVGARAIARPDLPLVQPSNTVSVAPGYRLEPSGPETVSIRGTAGIERGVEISIRGFGRFEAPVELTYLLDRSPEQIRQTWLGTEGAPHSARSRVAASDAVVRPERTAPTILPSEQWDRLSPEQRLLADRGFELFRSIDAEVGRSVDRLVTALPFEGGVAVFRAIRGGGKIFVAEDGSVMYRSSSYTFERALEEFRAGERTPLESFRSSTAERGTSVERGGGTASRAE